MPVIRNTAWIHCTPEEAFDYLSDLTNELDWNPDVESMQKITDGPVGVGTQWRAKWKSSPHVVVECIAYDKPRSWTCHNGGPIEVTFGARLEPEKGGTRLQVDFDPTPRGFVRLVFPMFIRRIRRVEAANMTYLRMALERRVGRPSTG